MRAFITGWRKHFDSAALRPTGIKWVMGMRSTNFRDFWRDGVRIVVYRRNTVDGQNPALPIIRNIP